MLRKKIREIQNFSFVKYAHLLFFVFGMLANTSFVKSIECLIWLKLLIRWKNQKSVSLLHILTMQFELNKKLNYENVN